MCPLQSYLALGTSYGIRLSTLKKGSRKLNTKVCTEHNLEYRKEAGKAGRWRLREVESPIPTLIGNQDETCKKAIYQTCAHPKFSLYGVFMICKILGQGKAPPSANPWFSS